MSTINLNELRDRAYKIARDHGFHDADWSNEHLHNSLLGTSI